MKTRVAVFTSDNNISEAFLKRNSSSGFVFVCNPDPGEFQQDHFVICDQKSFLQMQAEFSHVSRNLLFVISSSPDDENIDLIDKHKLEHLVGQNDDYFCEEIVTHLNRLAQGGTKGIAPFLERQNKIVSSAINDSTQIDQKVGAVLGQFNFAEYFDSPEIYLRVMANELITNALYKGPNQRREKNSLPPLDRSKAVVLDPSEVVQFHFAMDNKSLCLSVVDLFGGLSYDNLISALRRSIKDKTVLDKNDGAGIGLYLIYIYSNQFIVNVAPNSSTEIICMIDKTNRYKTYKQRIRSFHFFQEV